MKYRSFFLRNYKGIANEVTIDIGGDQFKPYCLLGNNESGKTTILNGIELIGRLCSGYQLKNGQLTAIRPKETYFSDDIILSAVLILDGQEIAEIQGKQKQVIKDDLVKASGEVRISFRYTFEESSFKESEISFKINGSHYTIDNSANLLEVIKKNAPEIIYYDDFKFDVPNKIRFLKETDESDPILTGDRILTSGQNIFWQEIFNDLLLGTSNRPNDRETKRNKNKFQRDVIDWTRNNDNDEDAVEQRIVAMNDYLNKVVTSDWEDITGEKSIFDRFSIKRSNTESSDKFVDYTLKVEAKGKSFALSERSKGCKWFFCFKVLTDIRKYRHDKGTLFLLDEPASNLHIHPQEKILNSLAALSGENSINVIYSTHSPFLIDTSNLDNIFIVDNKAEELDKTNITCTAIDNYQVTSDRDKNAIEPILNKIAIDGTLSRKEWIEKVKGQVKAGIKGAELVNTVWQFIENIKTVL